MIAAIIGRGIGFGGVNYISTLGFSIGSGVVVTPSHRIAILASRDTTFAVAASRDTTLSIPASRDTTFTLEAGT